MLLTSVYWITNHWQSLLSVWSVDLDMDLEYASGECFHEDEREYAVIT